MGSPTTLTLDLLNDNGVPVRAKTVKIVHEQNVLTLCGASGPWLLLKRTQGVFTAYSSSDGVTWNLGSTITVSLKSCLDAGLTVNGLKTNDGAALSRVKFDGVSICPTDFSIP